MRKVVALAFVAAVLAGCADDRDRMQAAVQCQQVGITQSSSEYASCLSAYTSLQREGTLKNAYHLALTPAPNDHMRRNQDEIY